MSWFSEKVMGGTAKRHKAQTAERKIEAATKEGQEQVTEQQEKLAGQAEMGKKLLEQQTGKATPQMEAERIDRSKVQDVTAQGPGTMQAGQVALDLL